VTVVGPLGGSQRSSRRLFVLRALIVALVVTLLARLWFVQVASGSKYAAAANANGTRDVVTQAVRGLLLDDEGKPLVENRTALVVALDHTALARQKDGGTAVLRRLAPLVSTPQRPVTATDLADLVRPCDYKKLKPPGCNTGSPYQPVPVASFVIGGPQRTDANVGTPEQVAAKIARIQEDHADFPGVVIQTQAVQVYPQQDIAAQILGYTDKVTADVLEDKNYKNVNPLDKVGRAGLEEQYDNQLRGTDGTQTVSVDAAGNVVGTVGQKAPVAGQDVVLNLDSKVQAAAQQALSTAVNTYGKTWDAKDAAAVVMTTDGRVLALASYPTFDANIFSDTLTQKEYQSLTSPALGQPLLDRATDQVYSPGSTWKVVTGSALLQNKVISGSTTQSCPPSVTVGNTPIRNFESESYPPMTLHTALQVSCDTFFYQYAAQQWVADGGYGQQGTGLSAKAKEIFPTMAKAYGFGSPTGIDLPHEAAGQILDRESNYQHYLQDKANFCKGAQLHKGTPRGQSDEAQCTDGWRYNEGDLVYFAIGQGSGVSITPLQEARAYAALANGGTLYEPTIAKAFVTPTGQKIADISPRVVGHLPVSAANLAYIRDGLVAVAKSGTASGVFGTYPVQVAGKTGTAEVDQYDANTGALTSSTDQSWFASFAPADHPKYVVLVTVPHSNQGAIVAAPAVRDIYNALFGVKDGKLVPGAAIFGGTGGATSPPTLLPCFAPSTGVVSAPTVTCSASHATVPPPAPSSVAPASSSGSAAALGAVADVQAEPPPRRGLPTRSGGVMSP
jgi:penicillin-binding protein 2